MIDSDDFFSINFILIKDKYRFLSKTDAYVMETAFKDDITEKKAFKIIADVMQFPDYFGYNLDALDECLSDMSWIPAKGYLLVLNKTSNYWESNPAFMMNFVKSWLDASDKWAKEGVSFQLIFTI